MGRGSAAWCVAPSYGVVIPAPRLEQSTTAPRPQSVAQPISGNSKPSRSRRSRKHQTTRQMIGASAAGTFAILRESQQRECSDPDIRIRLSSVSGTIAARIGVMLCGLVTGIVSARVLGPAGRGQYFAVTTISALLAQTMNLGAFVKQCVSRCMGPWQAVAAPSKQRLSLRDSHCNICRVSRCCCSYIGRSLGGASRDALGCLRDWPGGTVL